MSYCTVLTVLLEMMWDNKVPTWGNTVRWMMQALWCSLRLYWPSDHMSEGGSSASGPHWLWVTEITENKTVDKGDYCILIPKLGLSSITQGTNTYCDCPLPNEIPQLPPMECHWCCRRVQWMHFFSFAIFLITLMFNIRQRVLEFDGLVSVLWLPSGSVILGKSSKFSNSEFSLL